MNEKVLKWAEEHDGDDCCQYESVVLEAIENEYS